MIFSASLSVPGCCKQNCQPILLESSLVTSEYILCVLINVTGLLSKSGESGGLSLAAIKKIFSGPAPPPPSGSINMGLGGVATSGGLRFPKGDPRNCIKDGENTHIMQVRLFVHFLIKIIHNSFRIFVHWLDMD